MNDGPGALACRTLGFRMRSCMVFGGEQVEADFSDRQQLTGFRGE